MTDYVSDTHALIWYLEDSPRLGKEAARAFTECDQGASIIFVPTICIVEIVYLHEKGRIPVQLKTKLEDEFQNATTGLILLNLTVEIANLVARVPRELVPDMPDRIIAASAIHMGLPLISRDKRITTADLVTIW